MTPGDVVAAIRGRLTGHGPLLRNAGSLFGVTILTAGFGAVYWAIAARAFSPAAVGLAAAAISATQLLAQGSTLGLGTILIGELPRHRGSERSLVLSALAINVVLGGALGIVAGLIAGHAVPQLAELANPVALVVFAAGVAGTAAGLVLDQAFMGLLRGSLQLVRNGAASVLKLAALGAIAAAAATSRDGVLLFGTWVAGSVISMALVLRLPAPTGGERATIWHSTEGLAPLAVRHHLFNLSIFAPGLVLPLIVTAVLSTEANGYFYVAYLVASFGFAVPAAMAAALYAVGVRDVAGLVTRLRLAFGLCLAVAVVGAIGAAVLARPVLSVFGPAYAEHATGLLQLFALGVVPVTINSLFVPIVRVEGRFVDGTVRMVVSMVIELVTVVILAKLDGLQGAALGWLLGYTLGTLPFVPAVWRVVGRGRIQARSDREGLHPRAGVGPSSAAVRE